MRLLRLTLSWAVLVFAISCTNNDVFDPNTDCSNANTTTIGPTIKNFMPASGAIGTIITIEGTNFDTSPAQNTVYVGATKGIVTAASSTQLSVAVPIGATYKPISVTVGGLTGYSSQSFLVTFPATSGIDENSFIANVDFVAGPHPWDMAIGDLDGDGRPDLAIANSGESSVSVFRNVSIPGTLDSNSFAEAVDFELAASATSITIGDLDGDGKNDLAATTFNNISILQNNSTPGVIEFKVSQNNLVAGADPRSVAIGDLNGDGKPEVVAVNFDNGSGYYLSIFKNSSVFTGLEISFSPEQKLDTEMGPSSVAIGDLDKDGKPDLAVTNSMSNTVWVFKNSYCDREKISFAKAIHYETGLNPGFVAIGDIDNDTNADLVIANVSDNTLSVLRNKGTTTNGISFAGKVDYTTSDLPRSVDIGDLDGDGKPELVVSTIIGDISVFRNSGSSFADKIDFSIDWGINGSLGPVRVKVGDLDGDGKPDLCVANVHDIISIFRNNKF